MEDLTRHNDEDLASLIVVLEEGVGEIQRQVHNAKQEMMRRLRDRGATEFPHPDITCKIAQASPTYDLSRLAFLKELLPPEIIEETFTAAHEEIIQVPDKWDMRKTKGWGKRYGDDVQDVLDSARIPGREYLVCKRKENT